MKASPLQIVREKFGSRAAIAEQLAGMVDAHHGDENKDQIKSRLMGLSNGKLLRLYQVEQKVREQYGDRSKLIDHLCEKRIQAGLTADESFRGRLETYSKARLLDMARQKFAAKPEKLSPEQKAARKRGKKAAK